MLEGYPKKYSDERGVKICHGARVGLWRKKDIQKHGGENSEGFAKKSTKRSGAMKSRGGKDVDEMDGSVKGLNPERAREGSLKK